MRERERVLKTEVSERKRQIDRDRLREREVSERKRHIDR